MPTTRLRLAQPQEHALYAHFFAGLGTPDPPLDRERWQREYAATTAFLEQQGRPVGYAAWDASGEQVHVRHVVIEENRRGQGLGRILMLELARHLAARGARRWRLNVFASNAPAIALYQRVGLAGVYTTQVLNLPWEHIPRLASADSKARPLDPSQDAAAEARHGLLDGQLARARQLAGAKVLAAHSADGTLVGLAVFDERFPGAFPFRCSAPVHARTLLDAMRELYSGSEPVVRLVIEDDAATTAHLERAGTQRLKDIVHMRGELPQ